MTPPDYVHGYHAAETERLRAQAGTLADLLHHDTSYEPGSTVLEVGCGVGAQSLELARRSPQAQITSIDISTESLAEAQRRVDRDGLSNVRFQQADIFRLPFAPDSFDHVFLCFVLEHLSDPRVALQKLLLVLRPGGTLTIIEGDHGSAYFHPDSQAARDSIRCQILLQQRNGGDALIGRQLYPLMVSVEIEDVCVVPRNVYVDASRPDLVEGFIRRTFTAMIEGVREQAILGGLTDGDRFDDGIKALRRTTEIDGTFCYTFFKGVGQKGAC